MENVAPNGNGETGAARGAEVRRRFFSRDANYLRDVALFWPFAIYSMFAIGCVFPPGDRRLGLLFGAMAAVALVLAKERLLMFFVAMGFLATQCAIYLLLHRWNWEVGMVGLGTGIPFLLAYRYWRHPRLAYRVPEEFTLLDALWSVASIIAALALLFVVRQR